MSSLTHRLTSLLFRPSSITAFPRSTLSSFTPSFAPTTASFSSPLSPLFSIPSRPRTSHGRIVQGKTRRGIFGRKHIMFGNHVSHSERKTRRCWNPNVQLTTLHSEILGKKFQLRVTPYALRSIDKKGGLDEYLCKTPNHLLGEGKVLQLKALILPLFLQKQKEFRMAERKFIWEQKQKAKTQINGENSTNNA